jgi:acyl carrier protein
MGQEFNTEEEIRKIVAEILEIEPHEIDPDAQFIKDLGMDSMMALEVMAGIEKRYRIAIPEDKLPKFTNLRETVRIIAEILNKGS